MTVADFKVAGSLFLQDPIRRFRLRPRASGWFTEEGRTLVHINSMGYRDIERQKSKQPQTLRVAVVGDSNVAAFMVRDQETFTQVAEHALGIEQSGRTEVWNFGVPNYNLAQQYLTLRDDVLPVKPDLVIEAVSLTNGILNSTRQTCVNDAPFPYFVDDHGALKLYAPTEKHFLTERAESVILDAENRFTIALLWKNAWRALDAITEQWGQQLGVLEKTAPDFYIRSLYPPRDEAAARAWTLSEQTLGLMSVLSEKRGVPFWVMAMDFPGQVDPDPSEREKFRRALGGTDIYYADARICQFALSRNIPCIQTAPILANHATKTGHYVHGFFNTARNAGHLNAEGHKVLGNMLAKEIGRHLHERAEIN